jgi:hypothetical protein
MHPYTFLTDSLVLIAADADLEALKLGDDDVTGQSKYQLMTLILLKLARPISQSRWSFDGECVRTE